MLKDDGSWAEYDKALIKVMNVIELTIIVKG